MLSLCEMVIWFFLFFLLIVVFLILVLEWWCMKVCTVSFVVLSIVGGAFFLCIVLWVGSGSGFVAVASIIIKSLLGIWSLMRRIVIIVFILLSLVIRGWLFFLMSLVCIFIFYIFIVGFLKWVSFFVRLIRVVVWFFLCVIFSFMFVMFVCMRSGIIDVCGKIKRAICLQLLSFGYRLRRSLLLWWCIRCFFLG